MFNLLKTTKEVTTTTVTEGMTLEQVRVAMLQLMADENSNQHRMGQLYNYVVEKRLAEKAGYKDAKDFFRQRLADLSQATLSTYGAVAEAFSAPITRRFGVNCLYVEQVNQLVQALTGELPPVREAGLVEKTTVG